jgi:putative transposase
VVPFFAYPDQIRKIVYTTNAIESLHMQLRKVLKTRGHFPSDEAATKLIYLALRDITKKWKNPPSLGNWLQPNLRFDLVKDSLPWRFEK